MGQETSSPSVSCGILVLTLFLVPRVLKWDYTKKCTLQKGNQQVKGLQLKA